MFMVPEIDACLALAFRNRPNVTLQGEWFHLLLCQGQSELTVEDRPIPSVSARVSRAIASCVLSYVYVNPSLVLCSDYLRVPVLLLRRADLSEGPPAAAAER